MCYKYEAHTRHTHTFSILPADCAPIEQKTNGGKLPNQLNQIEMGPGFVLTYTLRRFLPLSLRSFGEAHPFWGLPSIDYKCTRLRVDVLIRGSHRAFAPQNSLKDQIRYFPEKGENKNQKRFFRSVFGC